MYFLDLLPMPSDLAALAVIIEYFDQLGPEQEEESGGKIWHKTQCFSLDYQHVSYILKTLVTDYQDTALYMAFQGEVVAHEEALLKICNHCMRFNFDGVSNDVSSRSLGERLSFSKRRRRL